MDILDVLFLLIVAHAVCDFVLQPEAMAMGKSRTDVRHQNEGFPPWYIWLGAHALTHGGGVYLVTGHLTLAVAEVVIHVFIDWLKCEEHIGFHMDQGLHVLTKFIYIGVLLM